MNTIDATTSTSVTSVFDDSDLEEVISFVMEHIIDSIPSQDKEFSFDDIAQLLKSADESIFDQLPIHLRQKFEEAVRNGSLSHIIEPWVPFWTQQISFDYSDSNSQDLMKKLLLYHRFEHL